MWLLESDDSEDKQKHRLLLGVDFTVGRKGCNLNLDDRSVSRKHATLVATIPDSTSSTDRPLLHLKDTSSFGTRINKKKVEQHVSTPLKDGDKIIFGSIKSTFWVRFSPLVVTSSCLEKPLKVDLERTVRILGGKIVAEWGPSCTHLVMQNLSITVKVICALAAQRPVVTVNYFKTLIESLKNVDAPTPEESSFLPKVSDSLAVKKVSVFGPNIKRKSLFNGKTFIFQSASQMKKMQEAIKLAGGSVRLQSEKNDISDQELTADDSLVMSPPSIGTKVPWMTHIQNVLESYSKRMITDAEIGHAVLSCSIQQYCNPNVDPGKQLDTLASQTMQTQTQLTLNSSTQFSMPLILNQSSKDKFNESLSTSKPSLSHHEDVSSKKDADVTEESTIEQVSKKRRLSSVEGSEEEGSEETSAKKQCVFKMPVLDEIFSSTRKSASTTLIPDTESQQTFIRPKPSLIIADSDPEDEESTSIFDKSKNDTREVLSASSKRTLNLFSEDKSGSDGKDSEKKKLDSPPKELVQDTPSTSSCSQSRSKKPFLVVEDSERSEHERSKMPDKETTVKIKEEVIDPAFETAGKQLKTSSQEPMTETIKEESQFENSTKNDVSSNNKKSRQVLADINVPEGFLTTRLPIKNQVTKIKREENTEEQPLLQVCMETIFTSLVANCSSKPPPTPNPDIATPSEAPEGFAYFRGKLVRNFKKFRKNALPQGFSLPRIIGGSDLVAHMTSHSKEIDEWMRQSKEQESQQNETERRAEELFNWSSRGKGRWPR